MKTEIVKIDEIFVAPKNVRRHPQKQIEELKKSFEMFGQYRPLIVASDGEILVGNGMYEALKLAGVESVEVKRLPDTATRTYKDKLMLADNKIYMLGTDDIVNIDEIMKTLEDFEVPGFDADILGELYSDADAEVEDFTNMGVLPTEKINQIKKIEESRENVDIQNMKVTKEDTTNTATTEKNEEGNYINCPHCGAKIWV